MENQKLLFGKRLGYAGLFWGVVLAVFFLSACSGRLPDLLEQAELKIPSLDRVVGEKPVITTSIDQAQTQLSFLDDFQPRAFDSLAGLERGTQNGFLLERPGCFAGEIRSYCLQSGTYAPTKGQGYAYAPLSGSGSSFIRTVLQNSVDHPEIPQRHIQVLLWAILARTRISDMAPEIRAAAAVLLSKEQADLIIGNAIDELREEGMKRLMRNLPEPARRVLAAEAQLRSLLTDVSATYEDIERVAVLFGQPEPMDHRLEVPRGRWSYHRDGYFIRYFPRTYSELRLEISYPEPYFIDRDTRGRITQVGNGQGDRIEFTYCADNEASPAAVESSAELQAFGLAMVRCVAVEAIGPEIICVRSEEWENPGWTLLGEAGQAIAPDDPDSVFSGLDLRLQEARDHVEEIDRVAAGLRAKSDRTTRNGIQERMRKDLVDLAHLARALEKTVFSQLGQKEDWVRDHALMLKKAWQYAFCAWQGKGFPLSAARPDSGFTPESVETEPSGPAVSAGQGGGDSDDPCDNPPPRPDPPPEMDPTDGTATPGNPGSQRLIGAPTDGGPKKPKPDCQTVRDAMKSLEIVRDAYLNNLPLPGEGGKEYDNRIHDMFNLGQPGGAVNPMGTSFDCIIYPEEAFYQGKPPALRASDCAHEKVHQARCRWAREHAAGGYEGWRMEAKNARQDEIDAYNAGIKFLQDWLAANDC